MGRAFNSFLLSCLLSSAPAVSAAAGAVIVDFFYEEGCAECARVTTEVLPLLEAAYAGSYTLNRLDVGADENYLRLAAAMERFGVTRNEPVFMLVDNRTLLAGYSEIAEGLIPAVEEGLEGSGPAAASEPRPEPAAFLAARIESFTAVGVLAGGLLDGINPCAIATLVFLISVLSMSHTSGRRLLAVGGAFCLASFLTYAAIGLGLLKALRALAYFELLRLAVETAFVLVLTVLAFLSFRDAVRFGKGHRAADVTLKLPETIRDRIHHMLRTRLGRRAQTATAFTVGAGVTTLESVCTGQVYLPTLALVVKSGVAPARGVLYLLLYNLMFVLPLLAALWLTYRGMRLNKLLAWSRNNVVASKVMLGAFFLALAVAMALLE